MQQEYTVGENADLVQTILDGAPPQRTADPLVTEAEELLEIARRVMRDKQGDREAVAAAVARGARVVRREWSPPQDNYQRQVTARGFERIVAIQVEHLVRSIADNQFSGDWQIGQWGVGQDLEFVTVSKADGYEEHAVGDRGKVQFRPRTKEVRYAVRRLRLVFDLVDVACAEPDLYDKGEPVAKQTAQLRLPPEVWALMSQKPEATVQQVDVPDSPAPSDLDAVMARLDQLERRNAELEEKLVIAAAPKPRKRAGPKAGARSRAKKVEPSKDS